MLELPLDRSGVHLTRDVVGLGGDSRTLSRAARGGTFVKLRRGAYVSSAAWPRPHEDRALLTMRAVALSAKSPPLFSHRSAATAWGIPFLTAGAPLAETLVAAASGGRSGRGIVRRGVDLPQVTTAVVNGMIVTSVERTIIDLARTVQFASAVIAADYALSDGRGQHAPLTTPERLRQEVERLGLTRGLTKVLRIIDFADGRSESANESLSRARFFELGFPIPELQVKIRHHTGITDRVDFLWRKYGHAGESDGLTKYRDAEMRKGRSAEDVVIDEKRREDRIRSQFPRLTRWEWADAFHPERLRNILLAAGLPMRGR